jgi:hypothetical protein
MPPRHVLEQTRAVRNPSNERIFLSAHEHQEVEAPRAITSRSTLDDIVDVIRDRLECTQPCKFGEGIKFPRIHKVAEFFNKNRGFIARKERPHILRAMLREGREKGLNFKEVFLFRRADFFLCLEGVAVAYRYAVDNTNCEVIVKSRELNDSLSAYQNIISVRVSLPFRKVEVLKEAVRALDPSIEMLLIASLDNLLPMGIGGYQYLVPTLGGASVVGIDQAKDYIRSLVSNGHIIEAQDQKDPDVLERKYVLPTSADDSTEMADGKIERTHGVKRLQTTLYCGKNSPVAFVVACATMSQRQKLSRVVSAFKLNGDSNPAITQKSIMRGLINSSVILPTVNRRPISVPKPQKSQEMATLCEDSDEE